MEVFPYQFGFFKRGEWAEVLPIAGKNKIADVVAMTFSTSALVASFETIKASLLTTGIVTQRNGWQPTTDFGHAGPGFVSPQFLAVLPLFTAMPLDDGGFDELDKIIAICAERNIDLKFFIGPIHPVISYLFWSTNGAAMSEWLTRVSMKPKVLSFLSAPEFREGELDKPKAYYMDSSHFSVPAAKLIMGDLMSYPRFRHARLLDSKSVHSILVEWQDQLADWAGLNPGYVDTVHKTFPQAKALRAVDPASGTAR